MGCTLAPAAWEHRGGTCVFPASDQVDRLGRRRSAEPHHLLLSSSPGEPRVLCPRAGPGSACLTDVWHLELRSVTKHNFGHIHTVTCLQQMQEWCMVSFLSFCLDRQHQKKSYIVLCKTVGWGYKNAANHRFSDEQHQASSGYFYVVLTLEFP